MKKNFTLVAGFMLAFSMQAQQALTPRAHEEVEAAKLEAAAERPTARRQLYAPQLRADYAAERRDTSLATGMSEYYSSETERDLRDSVQFVYDEYGRRKLELRKSGRCVRYTYKVGPQNMWTERVIETAYSDAEKMPDESLSGLDFQNFTKVERRINADLQVEMEASYTYDLTEQKWVLDYENTYDYSHRFKDDAGNWRRGHLIRQVTRSYGETNYQWFEPARMYIKVGTHSDYFKYVVEVGADNYAAASYYLNEDGTWEISDKDQRFYADGVNLGRYIYYYSDGKLKSVSGDRFGYEKSRTPGQFTLTHYLPSVDENGAVKESGNSKYEVTEGELSQNLIFYLEGLNVGFEGSYTYYSKNIVDGSWQFGSKSVCKTYPSGLCVQTKYDADGKEKGKQMSYGYLVTENQTAWGFVQWSEDGSCVAEMTAEPYEYKDWYDLQSHGITYAYLTPDYQLDKLVYRNQYDYSIPGIGVVCSFPIFYELKQDADVQLQVIDVMDTDGDYDFERYTYNDEGLLLTKEGYVNGKLDECEEYVYSAGKVERKRYEQGKKYLHEHTVYELMPDGTQRTTTWDLDGSVDKIDGGRRTETTADGWLKHYTYNTKQQSFELRESTVTNVDQTLADGTDVLTYFRQEGDKAVPYKKIESKRTVEGNLSVYVEATYDWNAAGERWVGSEKRADYAIEAASYYEPDLDAYSHYDDEYWYLSNLHEPTDKEVRTIRHEAHVNYAWDDEARRWTTELSDPEQVISFTQTDAQTCRIETREWKDGEIRMEYVYQINDDNQLLVRQQIMKYGEEFENRNQTYTYDDRKRLVKAEEQLEDRWDVRRTVYTFYYSTLQIFPTAEGIEEAKAADAGLRVEGREVVAADSQALITLYTADGRMVAKGQGRVEVPAAGIYVARTAKGSCKLLAR